MTQQLESQIGAGIAVLVALVVIFTVLCNAGAIGKAPIGGMSVGAAQYPEPVPVFNFERATGWRSATHWIQVPHATLGHLPLAPLSVLVNSR